MLVPLVAMVVTGYLAKQRGGAAPSQSGGLGGMLGGLLPAPAGGAGGGSRGLASMIDLDGDGNPLDDILRMAGKGLR